MTCNVSRIPPFSTTRCEHCPSMWGFPEIRGTILRVLLIRTRVFWGLYRGSPSFGKLQREPKIAPTSQAPSSRAAAERLRVKELRAWVLYMILDNGKENGNYYNSVVWVVVKIMVPFWVPITIWHLIFRVPKKGIIILTSTHILYRV